MKLPANLPSVSKAKLPVAYEEAKGALAKCSRVDECASWAHKAEALASYARQAKEDSLRKMADRIQARAIRRCGELLKAIKSPPGGQPSHSTKGSAPLSKNRAARNAGLSDDQRKTALRVANVPDEEFERAVESDDPPTVTALANQGKGPAPLVDLQGRDPEDFALSKQAQEHIRRLADFAESVHPETIALGTLSHEYESLHERAWIILEWLIELIPHMPESAGRVIQVKRVEPGGAGNDD